MRHVLTTTTRTSAAGTMRYVLAALTAADPLTGIAGATMRDVLATVRNVLATVRSTNASAIAAGIDHPLATAAAVLLIYNAVMGRSRA